MLEILLAFLIQFLVILGIFSFLAYCENWKNKKMDEHIKYK